MRSIEWNHQGQDMIPPLERLRFERGEPNERLEGTLEVHGEHVWYKAGEHHKVVARVLDAAPVDAAPEAENVASGPDNAPPAKSRKRAGKRKRK